MLHQRQVERVFWFGGHRVGGEEGWWAVGWEEGAMLTPWGSTRASQACQCTPGWLHSSSQPQEQNLCQTETSHSNEHPALPHTESARRGPPPRGKPPPPPPPPGWEGGREVGCELGAKVGGWENERERGREGGGRRSGCREGWEGEKGKGVRDQGGWSADGKGRRSGGRGGAGWGRGEEEGTSREVGMARGRRSGG